MPERPKQPISHADAVRELRSAIEVLGAIMRSGFTADASYSPLAAKRWLEDHGKTVAALEKAAAK